MGKKSFRKRTIIKVYNKKVCILYIFLSLLLILQGCFLKTKNKNSLLFEIETFTNEYRISHENLFVGIKIGHHLYDKDEALKIACQRARGELANSIKQEIISESDRIVAEEKYKNNSRIVGEFRKTVKAISDVQFPYLPKVKVYKYWKDENGHNFLVVAEFDREEYANYLLDRCSNKNILNVIIELKQALVKK